MSKLKLIRTCCIAVLFLAWILLPFPGSAGAQDKTTTVILVRHAEKLADTENPNLSIAGKLRAQELIRILGSAGITAVFTTPYHRTRDTANPLAEFLKLKPIEVDGKDSPGLARKILQEHAGETVFVSGHSNTVPEIIQALGARIDPIEDWEYDNLYVVCVPGQGPASVVRLKYGEPTE